MNNKIYQNQYEHELNFIKSKSYERISLNRGDMFIIVNEMMLIKEHPYLSDSHHSTLAHHAGYVSSKTRLHADAAVREHAFAIASAEFKSTGQIKGYECLSANNELFWISHFDLELMQEVK